VNKKMVLVVAVLIAATGCGSTIASEDTIASQDSSTSDSPALQTMKEYFANNPSLMGDLRGVQADMSAVTASANTGNPSAVESACENLRDSASSALALYGDAPLPPMIDAFQNLLDGAAACIAGDYSGAADYVYAASDDFSTATAQINAEG